jgi:hypothetical protein
MENEVCDYELQRLHLIESNRSRMVDAGLTDAVTKASRPAKVKKPRLPKQAREKENIEPRKSRRVQVNAVAKKVRAHIYYHSGYPASAKR